MELNATSVLITGGASGLGAATARLFARCGAKVALLDVNETAGNALAQEIGGLFVAVDVTDEASVTAGLATAQERQGVARVVVNCAGIAPAMKTVGRNGAHDMALFSKVVAINLIGAASVASKAAAAMMTLDPLPGGERGVIINTASVAAFEGQVGQIAYAASKGGVAALTLPMARDLADKGVRVMAIAPGIFKTPMLAAMPQEVQDALGAQVPFPNRLGDPAEYAALARHIVENPMLNGTVIRLDGAIRMAPR